MNIPTTHSPLLPISPSLFRTSAILVTLSMIAYGMGQTVVYAIVPPLARDMALSTFQIGLITSCAAVCAVIAAPLWGRASDHFGRRAVIAICLLLYSLTNALFTLVLKSGAEHALVGTSLLAALIASRAVFGAGSVGLQPATAALMADVSAPEQRGSAMAYVGLGLGLGMVLGPLYVVALARWEPMVSLFVLSLVPLPLLLLLFFTPKAPSSRHVDSGPKLRLGERTILPIVLLSIATYLGMAMLQQTIAFLVQDRLHLSSAAEAASPVGVALGGFAVAMLLAQIVMTRTAKQRPMLFIRIAMPIMATGYAVLLVGEDIRVMVAGMVAVGLGFGMAVPSLLAAASERVATNLQGAVAGVMSAAPALSFVIGPVLAGALYATAHWLPFAVLIGVSIAAGILATMLRSQVAKETPS